MRWLRRILAVLIALPVLAVIGLLVAGQRAGAGLNAERLAIARPPSQVYQHLVRPDLIRKWTRLAEVEVIGAPEMRLGSKLRLVSEARGERTIVEGDVTGAEPGRSLDLALRTVAGSSIAVTQRWEYRLTEHNGDTRLAVTSDTRYDSALARLLEPLITRSTQRNLEVGLERLRVQVEAEPVPR